MDVQSKLESLDSLVSRLHDDGGRCGVAEWNAARNAIGQLEGAAERLERSAATGREHAILLRHHLGILAGRRRHDGHSREQHVVWCLASLKMLRRAFAVAPRPVPVAGAAA